MTAKIIPLGNITKLDLPVERVLENVKKEVEGGVVVLGLDKDGDLYFASSIANGSDVLWLMELAKKRLLEIGDQEVDFEY